MKLGLIVLGTVVLAGSVTLGQTPMKDIADMERKLRDAEVALTRLVPSTLERDLRELQDELAYLRVKERRGESITTTERRNLNDRVDRYMSRLSPSRSGLATSREVAPAVGGRSIPSATEIDVRLQTRLSSNDGMVEDRVEATTMVDLYRGDDLLVDGGLVNPIPVSMCRALGAELVIAVDLNADLLSTARRGRSGMAAISADTEAKPESLLDRIQQKLAGALSLDNTDHDTPSMLDVVTASINIMQVRITRSRLAGEPADSLVTPRLAKFALLDFHRASEAIEEGEAATERAMPQIRSVLDR